MERANAERVRWTTDTSFEASRDASALAREARKSGEFELAISFTSDALIVWPGNAFLIGPLSWALYDRDIKSASEIPTREEALTAARAARRILELNINNLYEQYSAAPTALLKTAKILVAQDQHEKAIAVLDALNPRLLSNEQTNPDFPGHREQWYLRMTKALLEAEHWERTIDVANDALASASVSQRNRFWIEWRQAKAQHCLGHYDQAQPTLTRLVQMKRDYYLGELLALNMEALGLVEEAIITAKQVLAAPGPGDLASRYKTLCLLGRLLADSSPEESIKYFMLVSKLREEHGWQKDQDVESHIQSHNEHSSNSALELESMLRPTWGSIFAPETGVVPATGERISGTVVKHLNEGAGFIKPHNEIDQLYFSIKPGSSEKLPPVGSKVSFIKGKKFDQKKQRESTAAFKVRVED